jgi:8-oxo-dGTP diphosphatase
MRQLAIINPEQATEKEVAAYPVREAVQAVVFDTNNNIALLHVTKKKNYKLPGGGIEDNEDRTDALRRECLEEIGANVEIINELGSIDEYRKTFHLKQISYCYVAKLKGEKGTPNFTEEEVADGFEQVWLPYEAAMAALSTNIATDLESKAYIVPRDTLFLKEAARFFRSDTTT